eukprot:15343601-Ditylum_brightwellii.AAC.1
MPSTIYLITGGCRSGKSSYAQKLSETLCTNPIYLATSEYKGSYQNDDMIDRIQRHQNDRGEKWTTIEAPLYPSEHLKIMEGRVVLVDCLTLWLTNYMMEYKAFSLNNDDDNDDEKEAMMTSSSKERMAAADNASKAIETEFEKLTNQWNTTYIFVTNELGSGTHASDAFTRTFVDHQGWFNQFVARKANQVVHMVSGCATIIKKAPTTNVRDESVMKEEEKDEARMLDKFLSSRSIRMDSKGYFLVKLKEKRIFASFHSCMKNANGELCDLQGNKLSCHGKGPEAMKTWSARTAKELTKFIFEDWNDIKDVVSVSHAAYIGREAQRAEFCLYSNIAYQQD